MVMRQDCGAQCIKIPQRCRWHQQMTIFEAWYSTCVSSCSAQSTVEYVSIPNRRMHATVGVRLLASHLHGFLHCCISAQLGARTGVLVHEVRPLFVRNG